MTNNEAIKELISYFPKDNGMNNKDIIAFNVAISALQENAKLKADIEALRNELKWIYAKRDFGLVEIEELKRELEKSEIARNKQIDVLLQDIEQLKSELEKSVKLPCKVGDIVYTTNWLRSQVFKNITTGFQVYDGEIFILTYEGLRISDKNMGSHLFLTREEAEQSLKGQVSE